MTPSKFYLFIIWSQSWCRNIYDTIRYKFSCTSSLKFRNLLNISLEIKGYVSFVSVCKMIWLGFFWSNWMVWWFKSSSVAPEKLLVITWQPTSHNPFSKTPLMMDSLTNKVVFFSHCPFSVAIFSLASLHWKLLLSWQYSSLFYFRIVQLFLHWVIVL